MSDREEPKTTLEEGTGESPNTASAETSSTGIDFILGFLEPFLSQIEITKEEVRQAVLTAKPDKEPSNLLTRLLLGHEFPRLIEEMDRRIGEELHAQFKEAASKATCIEDIEAIDIDIDEIRGRHQVWLKAEIARRMTALME